MIDSWRRHRNLARAPWPGAKADELQESVYRSVDDLADHSCSQLSLIGSQYLVWPDEPALDADADSKCGVSEKAGAICLFALASLTCSRTLTLTAEVVWALLALASSLLPARRRWPSITVTIVAVSKNVPEHPSNHPILLLDAISIAAHVVDTLRFRSGIAIDVEDFPMERGLTDLGTAVRWFNGGIVPEVRCEGFRVHRHSTPSIDGFFLLGRRQPLNQVVAGSSCNLLPSSSSIISCDFLDAHPSSISRRILPSIRSVPVRVVVEPWRSVAIGVNSSTDKKEDLDACVCRP